jgi:hypothetical protein
MDDSSKPNRRDLVAAGALAALGATAATSAVAPRTAHAGPNTSLGLSKREMEKEVRWHLRKNIPTDSDKLAAHVVDIVVSLLDKNNKKIAEQLAASQDAADDF